MLRQLWKSFACASMLTTVSCCRESCAFAQVMRHDVALALGKSGPNVDVMCTDKEFGGRFMPFAKVRTGIPP